MGGGGWTLVLQLTPAVPSSWSRDRRTERIGSEFLKDQGANGAGSLRGQDGALLCGKDKPSEPSLQNRPHHLGSPSSKLV